VDQNKPGSLLKNRFDFSGFPGASVGSSWILDAV